jgi:hypothetical protein
MKVKYDQKVDVLTIQLSGAPVEERGGGFNDQVQKAQHDAA